MDRWEGRVALVTGASVGIGAGICRELVKHGMKVVGCARRVDKIEAIATEEKVLSASGELHAIKCDLSKEKEILDMFDEIRKKFGRIDVCINNAGFATNSSLISGKTEDWRSMMEVNVLGLLICTRESLKLMNEKDIDDGQIIFMNSIVGHRIPILQAKAAVPCFGFYYGTKFMITAVAESLRQQLKSDDSGIRVASISPGAVETEFLVRSMDAEIAKSFYSSAKCLQPQDIADAVKYILSSPLHVNVEDIIVQPIEMSF